MLLLWPLVLLLISVSLRIWSQTKELVAGVNSAADQLRLAQNDNCRLFEVSDQSCVLL